MRLANKNKKTNKNIITMRFSHFLGNVICNMLCFVFFFIMSLKNFYSLGLFQKQKTHGEEGRHLFSSSKSKAYWLNNIHCTLMIRF